MNLGNGEISGQEGFSTAEDVGERQGCEALTAHRCSTAVDEQAYRMYSTSGLISAAPHCSKLTRIEGTPLSMNCLILFAFIKALYFVPIISTGIIGQYQILLPLLSLAAYPQSPRLYIGRIEIVSSAASDSRATISPFRSEYNCR